MSVGPDLPRITIAELRARMPQGLTGLTATSSLEARKPTTLRGWLGVLRDSIVVDVLCRCHWHGCWKRRTYTNILGIGLCNDHFTEWYS